MMSTRPRVKLVPDVIPRRPIRISESALAVTCMATPSPTRHAAHMATRTFARAEPLKGVLPEGVAKSPRKLAMDSAIDDYMSYASFGAVFAEGLQFMGYPYLSELTQRPEYRRPAEILAKEMTRKWIKFQAAAGVDKSDRIKDLEAEMKRLRVKDLFCKAMEQDGFFGRSQIYIDMGVKINDRDELKSPLTPSSRKVGRRPIKRLTLVEPIWTYPNLYNATNPLDPTFFRPQTWFVMGSEIHHTRFLTFVSREVPDILKPSYSFGGLSLSQMCKPYVDNWLRTRQSVSDLIHSFSAFVLKTNMSSVLNQGAGDDIIARAVLFNQLRDNRGLQILDKDTEELVNISAPIGGLDKLQAQSQEHMSAVTGIPLIVLFGISPAGLNASSEGELKTFQDWVAGKQESDLRQQLTRLIHLIMLTMWGEIDNDIMFLFQPLWTLDAKAVGEMRKQEAETDGMYIDKGVLEPSEVRRRVALQEDSPYEGLDLNKEIVPPDDGNEDDEIGAGLNLGGGPDDKDNDAGKGEPPVGKKDRVEATA